MSLIAGILFGVGALAYSSYAGYRTVYTRRAYRSASNTPTDAAGPFHDETPVTVRGAVEVSEPAPLGQFYAGGDRPALVVWRLRRGKQSSVDERLGLGGDCKTVASGVAAGTFSVADGRRTIDVDPAWIVDRYGDGDVRSLSESDVTGRGPWSKRAWKSPFADLSGRQRSVWLDEIDTVPPELESAVGDDLDRYQLQTRSVFEGDELTVHGQVEVRRGTPVLCGTDAVPLTISGQTPDGAVEQLRNRQLTTAIVALGLFVAGAAALGWSVAQLVL